MVRCRYPEVRVEALSHNTGFGIANNLGIAQARGRYIALLNNDAFPGPRWLERLYRALEDHPEVGFCASKILRCPDLQLIDSVGDSFSVLGRGLKIGSGDLDEGQYDTPRLVFGASAAAAAYRSSMLEDVGLFDPEFSPANMEDVDLSFRAQLAGYNCMYVPGAVVHHRVSATLKHRGRESLYLHIRNSEFVFWKNMPPLLLLAFMPLHTLYGLGAMIFHVLNGRGILFLRAKRDAYRRLPAMWRKRQHIQQRRRVDARYIFSILNRDLIGTAAAILRYNRTRP
jgi:GT2 family glycosyltransferase